MAKKSTLHLLLGLASIPLLLLWVWATAGPPAAVADSPQLFPAFEGEPVSLTLSAAPHLNRLSIAAPVTAEGWTEVFSDTFEAGLNLAVWDTVDNDGPTNGEYSWSVENYTPTVTSGTHSAWAVGGGVDGTLLDPAVDGYPANVDSLLVLGMLDLSQVSDASVNLSYWLQSDPGDAFSIMASADGLTYSGLQTTAGGGGAFSSVSHNLKSYAGDDSVYLAFGFSSDASANAANNKGVFLDDVSIVVRPLAYQMLPLMRHDPTPTPTATPEPVNYRDEFTDPGSGWAVRRTNVVGTSNWAVTYFEGKLLLDIETANNYLLVSPLRAAPAVPYSLEIRADFRGDKVYDKHGYGIVFGGDWNGQPCPATDFSSCFNHYYWLHARYRDNNGAPKLELQLKRVTSHTGSNQQVIQVLWDWVAPNDFPGVHVAANDWTTWYVKVEADGAIDIYANGVRVTKLTGLPNVLSNLNGNPYFGLIQHVADSGDSTIQFEYMEVKKLP